MCTIRVDIPSTVSREDVLRRLKRYCRTALRFEKSMGVIYVDYRKGCKKKHALVQIYQAGVPESCVEVVE